MKRGAYFMLLDAAAIVI